MVSKTSVSRSIRSLSDAFPDSQGRSMTSGREHVGGWQGSLREAQLAHVDASPETISMN